MFNKSTRATINVLQTTKHSPAHRRCLQSGLTVTDGNRRASSAANEALHLHVELSSARRRLGAPFSLSNVLHVCMLIQWFASMAVNNQIYIHLAGNQPSETARMPAGDTGAA